jgi:AraC-like DNA-binding protein
MTLTPVFLRHAPTVDPLSDVLEFLTVERALSARLVAGGRWALAFPGVAHVKFGAVHRGECWLRPAPGAPEQHLRAGDCFVLVTGAGYAVAGAPGLRPVDGRPAFSQPVDGVARVGTGEEVVMTGGRFAFDAASARLLLDVLPPLIVVGADEARGTPLRATLDLLGHEAATPRLGASLVTARLGEIVFVEALRAALDAEGHELGGWLAAMADDRIGPALTLMHADLGRRWSVPELAAAVHLSRSTFAGRFRTLVGAPPLDHLLRMRMHAAARDLRRTDATVSAVGTAWGYTSDAAFSNAFKRVMGVSPRAWRTAARAAPPPPPDATDLPARRRAVPAGSGARSASLGG